MRSIKTLSIVMIVLSMVGTAKAYYTTNAQNIVDIKTGEVVQLRGIGLGGWLLPEGYMWGIRKLDRPRQFEEAIEELIGPRNAEKFWDLYHSNFVTREDVRVMKSWGVNTIRVPLLASMIQPRGNQPDEPPFVYDETKFKYLDDFVQWCEELGMGVIWDLHGAPGGQNAENISDSDGEARLWTEKDKYWPMTIDLWDKITKRYADKTCIVGYDLLNEPLLARYSGIDPALLRELYILTTAKIRETDAQGIIFIEGDDWAQDFSVLEPMDWDPHLVMAFHSYPPTHSERGLQRWDALRQKYNIPLWHGETGEQNPPWKLYERSTKFLEEANVGWNWWTHKKFELSRQPWSIQRTDGFEKILAYWNGNGPKPSRWQARRWLFKQARLTNSQHCDFLPGMVKSLHPLDPAEHLEKLGTKAPVIIKNSRGGQFMDGYAAVLRVEASGYPLTYQWYQNNELLPGATEFELNLYELEDKQRSGFFHCEIMNEKGKVQTETIELEWVPFEGTQIEFTKIPPEIDGLRDDTWTEVERHTLDKTISGSISGPADLSGSYSALWDWANLYFFVTIHDDSLSTSSSVDHLRDGIEIYIDADNSKSKYFGNDDYQLRYILNEDSLYADIGAYFKGGRVALNGLGEVWSLEIAIPWESLDATVVLQNQYIGLDVHINDSDSFTRNGKISWFGTRDNAYQSPANFGTVKLVD